MTLILNILIFFNFFIKLYKIICFSKIILNWLPVFNPYIWPFFYFKILTNFYFSFWKKTLKFVNRTKFAFSFSDMIAMEFLNLLSIHLQSLIIYIKNNN
jgi:hypothetical protein